MQLLILLQITRHQISTLFPYTTLFRSRTTTKTRHHRRRRRHLENRMFKALTKLAIAVALLTASAWASNVTGRSEEHTSELQSRENLVCRLLLEKTKENFKQKYERKSIC